MEKKLTVEEVTELITKTFTPSYVATEEGQAHLNRTGKAVTNESLNKRKESQRKTLAGIAFNKQLAKVASDQAKVEELLILKEEWITKYIAKHYESDED